MPGIFIPMDTLGNSDYFDKIYRKGLIYSFAYNYADNHRETLSGFESAEGLEAYLNKENILNEFVNYARENGIPRDESGLKQSGEIIGTQIKAYIARNIMGEEGFYPIIREIDKTLQEAIKVTKQNLVVENLLKEKK